MLQNLPWLPEASALAAPLSRVWGLAAGSLLRPWCTFWLYSDTAEWVLIIINAHHQNSPVHHKVQSGFPRTRGHSSHRALLMVPRQAPKHMGTPGSRQLAWAKEHT